MAFPHIFHFCQARDFPLSQVEDALYSLEPQAISDLGFSLDDESVLPYFLQAYINPWRLTSKRGVSVRILQKVPLTDEELQQVWADDAAYTPTYYGQDLGRKCIIVLTLNVTSKQSHTSMCYSIFPKLRGHGRGSQSTNARVCGDVCVWSSGKSSASTILWFHQRPNH
jgi:hypothetical protein